MEMAMRIREMVRIRCFGGGGGLDSKYITNAAILEAQNSPPGVLMKRKKQGDLRHPHSIPIEGTRTERGPSIHS